MLDSIVSICYNLDVTNKGTQLSHVAVERNIRNATGRKAKNLNIIE